MLTDFGLAKNLKAEEKAMTFCGTPEYLSPEVLLGKGHNRPTDWWTLGILIYEMIFGIPPFYAKDRKQMYTKTVKEPVVFRTSSTISDQGKDIINQLLNKDQTKRLGSKSDSLEVLAHPWFAEIDVSLLLDRKLPAPFIPELKNWEANFDKEYTKENANDEKKEIEDEKELKELEGFQAEFKKLDYQKE